VRKKKEGEREEKNIYDVAYGKNILTIYVKERI
jgi:hypothetical protein